MIYIYDLGDGQVLNIPYAIWSMRNSMNSWSLGDSNWAKKGSDFVIGEKDLALAKKLALAGTSHAKYRRKIIVNMDIRAPLYWWKQFDTYKIGTVCDSSSTMHKIHDHKFTREDFSCEHLMEFKGGNVDGETPMAQVNLDFLSPMGILDATIKSLNESRRLYLETKDKKYWWQMIQTLPDSYYQFRSITLNYEVLHKIYSERRAHKLDEWTIFCAWAEQLPYFDEIIWPEGSKEVYGDAD